MKIYERLTVYCDGGARGNPGPGAVGVVIKNQNEIIVKFGKRIGETTNNRAEYLAVIAALDFLKKQKMRAGQIDFRLDSTIVAKQLSNLYKVKDGRLRELLLKVRFLEQEVGGAISYNVIPREKNREADREVNLAFDQAV